jgi:hypothetical protein
MAACRSCGAPIFWARVATSGSSMPVNEKPDPKGNLILRNGEVRVQTKRDPAGLRYLSHFATCPKAKEHRHA